MTFGQGCKNTEPEVIMMECFQYQWGFLRERPQSLTPIKKETQRGQGGLWPMAYFLTCFGDVEFDF